jgi:hypothetical protein
MLIPEGFLIGPGSESNIFKILINVLKIVVPEAPRRPIFQYMLVKNVGPGGSSPDAGSELNTLNNVIKILKSLIPARPADQYFQYVDQNIETSVPEAPRRPMFEYVC